MSLPKKEATCPNCNVRLEPGAVRCDDCEKYEQDQIEEDVCTDTE